LTAKIIIVIIVIQIITNNNKNMRNIVNISLPDSMVRIVKKDVKDGGFVSTSEFMRHLIRLWNTKQLGAEFKEDRLSFDAGDGTELKSLKDLR